MTRTGLVFLVDWKRARIQYERLVKIIDSVNAVSIRDSVDPNCWKLVDCVLNVDLHKDVTEEMVMKFVKKSVRTVLWMRTLEQFLKRIKISNWVWMGPIPILYA